MENQEEHIDKESMTKTNIFMPCPRKVKLEPEKEYVWCKCGLSKSQPFCDGSHVGTPFSPVKFTVKSKSTFALCLCKRNSEKSGPFCDGSHTELEW